MVMVVDGSDDNNICFEVILISHPKFYWRNTGWDRTFFKRNRI
jgi:hypothetical protein